MATLNIFGDSFNNEDQEIRKPARFPEAGFWTITSSIKATAKGVEVAKSNFSQDYGKIKWAIIDTSISSEKNPELFTTYRLLSVSDVTGYRDMGKTLDQLKEMPTIEFEWYGQRILDRFNPGDVVRLPEDFKITFRTAPSYGGSYAIAGFKFISKTSLQVVTDDEDEADS